MRKRIDAPLTIYSAEYLVLSSHESRTEVGEHEVAGKNSSFIDAGGALNSSEARDDERRSMPEHIFEEVALRGTKLTNEEIGNKNPMHR